jgi:hypothetical protein
MEQRLISSLVVLLGFCSIPPNNTPPAESKAMKEKAPESLPATLVTTEEVELSIVGQVKQIEMLGKRAMSVWSVDIDPRFVVTVQVEEAPAPFVVGAETNLAIHSVARVFMEDAKTVIGHRYIFTLRGTKEGRKYQFSSVSASPK